MGIDLTAIICTHNRANHLRRALQSLREQTLPKDQYEILVVDNASRDDTRQVVESETSRIGNLRYAYEANLGLSHARNTGLRSARGTWLAYLDDDAEACPEWLEKIRDAYEKSDRQIGAVGGKVEPIWEAPRPAWLSNKLIPILTIVDWSATPLYIEGEEPWLAGANISFPRRLLEEIGGFDTRLGRMGHCLLSGEEALAETQLKSRGYVSLYDPAIAVRHHILAERLRRKWFLSRFYWHGVSRAILQKRLSLPQTGPPPPFPSIRIRRRLPRYLRGWVHAGVLTDPAERFVAQCLAASACGYAWTRARQASRRIPNRLWNWSARRTA